MKHCKVFCLFQEVPGCPGCILLMLLIAFQLKEKEKLQMICRPVPVGSQTVNNHKELYIMVFSVDADISGKPKQCSIMNEACSTIDAGQKCISAHTAVHLSALCMNNTIFLCQTLK